MKTTSIKSRILNVLAQNEDEPYLKISQIAKRAYGDAYIRDTKKHLDGLVRRNIYSAMELAIENNMIILPVKRKNEITGEIEKKILGYKIADKMDSDYIHILLMDREKRASAYILAYNRLNENLLDKNLIENKTQFKLISN